MGRRDMRLDDRTGPGYGTAANPGAAVIFANSTVPSGGLRPSRFACALALATSALAVMCAGCGDAPDTKVVLDNRYPSTPTSALVVFRAAWQAVTFPDPIAPGASSEPQTALSSSANTAYVLLAPGWDPASLTPPTSFVVLESRDGYELHLNGTLHLPVDDADFAGNCAAGSPLSQTQADFITTRVFPDVFAGLHYDAATCVTSKDASAP